MKAKAKARDKARVKARVKAKAVATVRTGKMDSSVAWEAVARTVYAVGVASHVTAT